MSASTPNGRTHVAPNASLIAESTRKAKVLMEALPYIRQFKGKTVVIKYGGSAMADEGLRESFAGDVSLLSMVGIRTVVVHGGGPQITRAMAQAGVKPEWVDGLRVTDAATIRVVQTTLAGEVNPDIVRLLSTHGAKAVGITGLDNHLFAARPRDERLGFVGEIDRVDPEIVLGLLDRDMVPVIAPLARGADHATYNLNADTAAGALAKALGAEKLVYLTDVEGLYRDLGDADSLVSRITVAELQQLIESGSASSGMLPKLGSCIDAMQGGVRRTHILDGRVQHALLLEIFTEQGIGTMVVQ